MAESESEKKQTLFAGDPKYRVPNMNPMVIPELALWQGTSAVGLKMAWKNAEIHGLKDAEMLDCE